MSTQGGYLQPALSDFIAEYLDAQRVRMRSFASAARHGRRWIARFKGRMLRAILPLDIEGWVTKRAQETAPATVNRELSFLRRVFNVALANGLVDCNPVKQVKFLREPSGRVRFLSDDEEGRLRHETGEWHWPAIAFAINTGLRQGEQFRLRWF